METTIGVGDWVKVKMEETIGGGGEYVHIHTYVPTTTRATVCYIREM